MGGATDLNPAGNDINQIGDAIYRGRSKTRLIHLYIGVLAIQFTILMLALPVFSLICMAFGSCQWILIQGGANMRENKIMSHTLTVFIYPRKFDFQRVDPFCSDTLSSSGFESITIPYYDDAICDVTTNTPPALV